MCFLTNSKRERYIIACIIFNLNWNSLLFFFILRVCVLYLLVLSFVHGFTTHNHEVEWRGGGKKNRTERVCVEKNSSTVSERRRRDWTYKNYKRKTLFASFNKSAIVQHFKVDFHVCFFLFSTQSSRLGRERSFAGSSRAESKPEKKRIKMNGGEKIKSQTNYFMSEINQLLSGQDEWRGMLHLRLDKRLTCWCFGMTTQIEREKES